MSDQQRREILTDVAEGRLNPAEAAERLAALDQPHSPSPAGDPGLRRVRVVGSGKVRVMGDEGVREAVAEGACSARREGDTLVITPEDDEEGFSFGSVGVGWLMAGGGSRRPRPVAVRMHPDLALSAEVGGGDLVVRGVRGPISAEVAAGSVSINGFAGPLDLDVSAGRAAAAGVLDSGQSFVRCHAGSVNLHLLQGSSVRVHGEARAGRVVLPGTAEPGPGRSRRFASDTQEAVVGEGTGSLDVEVNAGSVVIRADG